VNVSGVVAGAAVGAGLAASLALLVLGVRGVVVDPTRPPSRAARLRVALASPALTGRVVTGAGIGAGTLVLTRWPVAAAGLALLVWMWPALFGGTRIEAAQITRLEALVIWTESLRDTVAAHASLEQAIPATTAGAPAVIRPALHRLAGQIRARAPMDAALKGLATELADPSADLVIAALILNVRRRGDRLGEVLSGLAAAAREELDMRRRVSAGRAGLRRGVQIVVVLTLVFAMFLIVFGGEYVAPYDTAAGQAALAVVVALFGAGFVWLRRLSAADPVAPFLSRPGVRPDPGDLLVVASLTGVSGAAAETLTADAVVSGRAGGTR
jgi:tight adherence protein B